MTEKIQVRIFPNGRIEAETVGIKEESCTDVIPLLEEWLNAKAVEAAYTQEFYEVAHARVQQIRESKEKNQ